ncbi:fungal zn(2)-Cys(6) binuclear cluster domain-containing protein [Hirsutella rhossiliensis]|uniref:Fungal zn(2)-Cys(6) binuclear cluster domain-containing protein n=1 Tax=Hirsutella rhossiliensis TaxID=111463 RepID=A0A9P8MPZ5_9HYPO|nr:fungal zn(2)-Cys(6) binuclear cluster domain-containing protein [Hirsutella rhossiliensis]KAH0960148.1 fungal zn(2)-Cys(6) binuclear cluster domain-containing protein [Hirsutella rhossiliensis]
MAQSQYGTAHSSPGAVTTPAQQIQPPPQSQTTAGAAPASGQLPPQHKRVYQACIPCRRRKVRCDLGSVDNPHDPPCVRCRRESKECFFSATRRKRKTDDDEGSDADDPPAPLDRRYYSEVPLTPGGSHGQTQPLRRPDDNTRPRDRRGSELDGEGDANQTLENFEAQAVMRRGMYGPHDALDLLYKAATDSPAADHRREGSTTSVTPLAPPPASAQDPASLNHPPPPPIASRPEHAKHLQQQQPVDPELAQQLPALRSNPGYIHALRAWSRFRFVRAGWFTAQEAIEYIDYYYKYLSPMTPISPPTFSDPASHLTLLTEEPILTVTLLTIASRYRQMPGTGGHCRSHAIPEQLWTYLRGMIERCLWGQEAFGGGFCGSGGSSSLIMEEADTSSTAPWRGMRKGSLRTLGTIESLLILTEWHPRALHFPPQEATDELILPDYDSAPMSGSFDASRNVGAGFGGKRIESWLEPAWRSDRMCWMLLSTAMGLAYELGVFDDIDEMLKDDAITRPEFQDEGYRMRANRIKRLLLIYTSQLAGRLGWTSMTPEHLRKSDPAVMRRRTMSNDGATPSTSSLINGFNYVPDLEMDDQIIHCWAGISNAMHLGNEKLFRTRKHTTEIIQSGKYVELLREFGPMLRDWYREFELFRLPQFIRHILTIEYEYVRIYVNSLSLQAVVERCTNHAANGANGNGQAPMQQLSPQTMINYGKLPLGQLGGFTVHDQEYVREVVGGSRNLLRTVVEGLLPGGYLKHAPVRTYFRIISGAMFLLKTFALGAPRSDVKISIDLMDATVEALRNCVVDDVHLGIRFADLLETLTSRLRNRFIQAPTMQQSSSGKGQSPVPEGANGVGGATGQQNSDAAANWVSGHAQKLREGLNGQYRAGSPSAEANNISATPFDLSTGNFPYPGASSIGPSTPAPHVDMNPTAPGGGVDMHLFEEWNNPGNEMWYLPTGPAFFQNMENSAVAMTAEGVNVGGLDLLEYMAMDPVQFSGMEGSGSTTGAGNDNSGGTAV